MPPPLTVRSLADARALAAGRGATLRSAEDPADRLAAAVDKVAAALLQQQEILARLAELTIARAEPQPAPARPSATPAPLPPEPAAPVAAPAPTAPAPVSVAALDAPPPPPLAPPRPMQIAVVRDQRARLAELVLTDAAGQPHVLRVMRDQRGFVSGVSGALMRVVVQRGRGGRQIDGVIVQPGE